MPWLSAVLVGEPRRLGGDARRQLRTGRMAHQEHPLGLAAALGRVRLHPGDGSGHVAELRLPVHRQTSRYPMTAAPMPWPARKRPMLR